ncbi:MAG: hypothetical protein JNJ39_13820 [Blastocatellia bacterium]|nr:hypothetical protein [Blastocatellia bacterium]
MASFLFAYAAIPIRPVAKNEITEGAVPTPSSTPPREGVDSIYSKRVAENAKLYDIEPLQRQVFSPDDFGVRIWVGFDNTFPRCLFVLRAGNRSETTFVSGALDVNGRPIVQNGLEPLSELSSDNLKELLNIDTFLKQDYPADEGWGDPDGKSVVVEIRRGNSYKLIRYQVGTDSKYGTDVIDYVRRVENLYKIQLLPRKKYA